MDDIETDIGVIQNLLADVESRIAAKDTNIQLENSQYIKLRSDIWNALSPLTLELSIDDHKRKLVIYGLETRGYNVKDNNRAIYKSILADANFSRDQLPDSCTLRVDFLARRTKDSDRKSTRLNSSHSSLSRMPSSA